MKSKFTDNICIWAFTLVILCACEKKQIENHELRNVILTTARAQGLKESKEYSGVIEESKSVNASFMTDGKINHIYVKEGQRVTKDQLLASLDDADYQIGLNQLKAQYNQMTQEKKRMDEMFNRHNIAPNDYEKFIAGYEQLKLQLEMMENKIGYTKLYSPSSGYVAEKFMEPGELVGAGTPIFKITDDSRLVANVDLPVEVYLHRHNVKKISGYTPALPNESIPLSIESITPDPANTMLYQMKLSIPAKYSSILSPGMNIRVKIGSENTGITGEEVPARAVFEENGQNYVWVFEPKDSTIHKKHVTISGTPNGNRISINGLDGEEYVVETGVKQLYDGEKVHPVDKTNYGL